jgi:formylglycine-generating enzyme required for sulfatase activity
MKHAFGCIIIFVLLAGCSFFGSRESGGSGQRYTEMVRVPGGTFIQAKDEYYSFKNTVSPFRIAKYPVT